jgi:hypothetical protein
MQQFGPCKGHYRIVKSIVVNMSYETAIAMVQHINDRLGVEREGKQIFPRIGQKYFAIRRLSNDDKRG